VITVDTRRVSTEMKALATVALLGAVLAGCGGGSSETNKAAGGTTTASPVRAHLDCAKGRAGSEAALRHFTTILRGGSQREIRSVLIDRPRFFALSANGKPDPNVNVRYDPDKAARAVADRGGLPITIARFMNSEPPSRNADFGFRGHWNGARRLIGKAAIDCTQGKVIVFNVGVRPR
jgi:hypothetical protein